MIKERPILFSTPMVQAIIENRKTQTRRTINPRTPEAIALLINMGAGLNLEEAKGEMVRCFSPYGHVGDILWVRETWMYSDADDYETNPYAYRATHELEYKEEFWLNGHWRPSIHMPKDAARIWLKVKDVRVERVQDISEIDAKAEGVKLSESGKHYLNYLYEKYRTTQFIYCEDKARNSFQSLWHVINGPVSWRENPWVWVVEFEVLSTTGKPNELTEGQE